MNESVGFYEGAFYMLSNFSAHEVVFRGETFKTSEHAYQAAKFADPIIRRKIVTASSAFLAREYGQAPLGMTENFNKVFIMKEIMRAKLQQHFDVQEALRKIGHADIIKNHPDDYFWGAGADDSGENVMGKIWMELRDEMNNKIIFNYPPENFNPKFTCAAVFVEFEDKILFLERLGHKPEPYRWGHPAGKVDEGESDADAARRELLEETGIAVNPSELQFLSNVYVRYPNVDFVFAMFRVKLAESPTIAIRPDEHNSFCWMTISEALQADLVTGTHECVRKHYSDRI